MGEGSGGVEGGDGWRCYCWAGPNCWAGPLLCLFYSFYFLFLFISSLWHMSKASPCSPRRRLALQTGSLAVPRLNALRTLLFGAKKNGMVNIIIYKDQPIFR